jgi:hypothetical protein
MCMYGDAPYNAGDETRVAVKPKDDKNCRKEPL